MLGAGSTADSAIEVRDAAKDQSCPGRVHRISLHKAVIFLLVADCMVLATSGMAPILAEWVRIGFEPPTMSAEIVALAIALFLSCQFALGAYKRKRALVMGQSLRRALIALFVTFSLIFMLAAAAKVTSGYSRLWFFSWMIASFVGISVLRWLVIGRFQFELASGAYVHRCAALGVLAQPLSDAEIRIRSQSASRVFVSQSFSEIYDLLALDQLVNKHHLDEVYISVPWKQAPSVFEVLNRQQHVSANVYVCTTADEHISPLLDARMVDGRIQLKVLDRPIDGWHSVGKRILDLVVAYSALVLFAPLMAFVAVAIKLESPGPVFFRQMRQGFNGQAFEVLKFRSMRNDKTDLRADRQTRRGDDRVTRVGRFIRRTSIDELPQIFNVISGEMSIVGPRPHALGTTAEGQTLNAAVREYALRHRVKPGLTGWAQVNGLRGELDSIEKLRRRVQFDISYIENWSIGFDLSIIRKTLFLVLRDQAAY